ncbi:MAG: hypothetical protein KDA37_14380 [Planctomycetales bacterium]|nr:hypothetical protein [Planctomycetales bacterium]
MYRFVTTILLLQPAWGIAAYVNPTMGGGQITQGAAGMKHADISFLGGAISVVLDETVPTPVLRPLEAGLQFDPDGVWGMINHHAYNFQYGWNPSVFDAYPPPGAWLWIEQLGASPGLKTYQQPPAEPTGLPIFGTEGSSPRWRWSGEMTHNVYAVEAPRDSSYYATYRVYIGYDATGDPVSGYQPAEVTFNFTAEGLLPGDYNADGAVRAADYTLWRDNVGQPAGALPNDPHESPIGAQQYAAWRENYGASAHTTAEVNTVSTPEPGASILIVLSALMFFVDARRPNG